MGLLDWLRRIFGAEPTTRRTPTEVGQAGPCPQCGFTYAYDGVGCGHCGYAGGPVRCCPRCRASALWDGRHCRRCGYPGPDERPAPMPGEAPPSQAAEAPSAPARRVSTELTGLDASAFAPMGRDEAAEFIRGFGSSWKNAYLDSLSVIPPAKLPRIQLIDRAMVGLGLIKPEELVEIHEVGEQMAQARGDLTTAYRMAEQAVAQTQAERQALKQQKKAEAEQRRQQRAREIAERKRTDIIFLGRGVSKGLADRRANVEKLQAAGLPVLATPADLANALGLQIPRLRWLAYHTEASAVTHYVRFTVPKRSGGTRELAAPHRDLARCQEWILTDILRKVPVHDAAQGFVPTRSTVTNATRHVGCHVVVNADLKDFFPTVTFPRVKGIFQAMGYSPAAATILGLLCTACTRRTVEYDGKTLHVATGPRALPQGACTSPALSNLVARRFDARLTGLAGKLAWTYTRYADDLTFSAAGEPARQVGYVLARLRHIAADEGFTVNESKTRVLRRNAAQTVTGIVVNKRPGVPRKLVRRLRAILHHAKTEGLDAQNRQNHPCFNSWLTGMIAYVSMVNPDQGQRLRGAYQAL